MTTLVRATRWYNKVLLRWKMYITLNNFNSNYFKISTDHINCLMPNHALFYEYQSNEYPNRTKEEKKSSLPKWVLPGIELCPPCPQSIPLGHRDRRILLFIFDFILSYTKSDFVTTRTDRKIETAF